jgi:hypothetical protein
MISKFSLIFLNLTSPPNFNPNWSNPYPPETKNQSPKELNNAKRGDLFVFNTAQVRDRVTDRAQGDVFANKQTHTGKVCAYFIDKGVTAARQVHRDVTMSRKQARSVRKSRRRKQTSRFGRGEADVFLLQKSRIPSATQPHTVYFRCERAHSLCLFSY